MYYDVKEEWWKNNDVRGTFQRFESLRHYTRHANSEIVRDVMKNLKIEGVPNLEIGCGDGELYRLVPDLYEELRIVPTDLSEPACRLFKEHTGIDAMVMDARKLPVRDEQFGMIVGYSVADVIPYNDYQELFEEIKRALKPGGYFIHFLDLQPNIGNIIDSVRREYPDHYIFPWCDEIDMPYVDGIVGWNGLQLMEKDKFSEYFSSLNPHERPLIDFLVRYPFKTLTDFKLKGKVGIACSISADAFPFCKERFDLVAYFRGNLRKMEDHGFEIIKDETIYATTPNSIDESTFINKVGIFYKIPSGREVYSEIHVFISKKL